MIEVEAYRQFLRSSGNFLVAANSGLNSGRCRNMAASLPHDYAFHFVARDHAYLHEALAESLTGFGALRVCRPMLDEIVDLTRWLAIASTVSTPFVSLRVITRAYCLRERPSVSRYYHRDSAAVTITKAYFGEGCVYAHNDNVRRDYFKRHSIQQTSVSDRDILVDPKCVHVVADGATLLLKGEVYPGIDARSRAFLAAIAPSSTEVTFNRDNGLIHRGGGFSMGRRRLVFTASVAYPGPC